MESVHYFLTLLQSSESVAWKSALCEVTTCIGPTCMHSFPSQTSRPDLLLFMSPYKRVEASTTHLFSQVDTTKKQAVNRRLNILFVLSFFFEIDDYIRLLFLLFNMENFSQSRDFYFFSLLLLFCF